jgi:glycosyltransferase involved in cell wall biosynthesis
LGHEVEIESGLTVLYCRRTAGISISPMLLWMLSAYVGWADIVHLTSVYSFATLPTLLTARTLQKPLVLSPRGSLQLWPGRRRAVIKLAWDWMCRGLAPANFALHVTSEAEARESARRLGERQIFLVENGIAVPQTLPEPIPCPGNSLRLLYLGRLDPKKGIENLLAALKLLLDSGLRVSLTVAGAGETRYEHSLRYRIGELKLTEAVSLLGDVRDTAKEDAFRAADVLVMPSFTENFGIVVAEALARCVPVIVSKGTPWSAVEQHGCGLYVDNSPESLARSIQQISTMPLHEMGERGRRWMITHFSWPEIAQRMLRVYGMLLEGNGSTAGDLAFGS